MLIFLKANRDVTVFKRSRWEAHRKITFSQERAFEWSETVSGPCFPNASMGLGRVYRIKQKDVSASAPQALPLFAKTGIQVLQCLVTLMGGRSLPHLRM